MQCRKLFGRVSTKQYMGFPAGYHRLVKYYFSSDRGLCHYLGLNGSHKYVYFSQHLHVKRKYKLVENVESDSLMQLLNEK